MKGTKIAEAFAELGTAQPQLVFTFKGEDWCGKKIW